MKIMLFEKFNNTITNKVDLYYLKDNINSSIPYIYSKDISDNKYRALATFTRFISKFKGFGYKTIALAAYPPIHKNFRYLERELEDAFKQLPDEIEFPLYLEQLKYINLFKDISKKSMESGILLRPMIETDLYTDEQIIQIINFIKQYGIFSICLSTGLIEKCIDEKRLDELKRKIPNIFSIKVISKIEILSQAEKFIKNGADIVATQNIL